MTEPTNNATPDDDPQVEEHTGLELIPSPDVPEGADVQLELEEQMDTDRPCACITSGAWTPTDQCALRPATRCTTGAPVWLAFQVGGPDAAAERIAGAS